MIFADFELRYFQPRFIVASEGLLLCSPFTLLIYFPLTSWCNPRHLVVIKQATHPVFFDPYFDPEQEING